MTQNGMGADRLLTTAELAEYLNLSKMTIYKWIRRGEMEFPRIRVGGMLRYRLSDVNAWLETKKICPQRQEVPNQALAR